MVKMANHIEARCFEISKLKNLLEKLSNLLRSLKFLTCQASKMKLFVKIVNYIQSLFIFTKSFILDVGQASELTSVQYIIKVNKPNKVKTNKDTCYISALETLKEP